MKLFNPLRKEKQLASPESVAARLNSYARKGLDESKLPDLDKRYRPQVGLNYFFTKAAITIQWLRILERDPSSAVRAKAVFAEYERLTFSGLKADQRAILADHLQKLIKIATEIKLLVEDKTRPVEEFTEQTLELAEKWFFTALDERKSAKNASLVSLNGVSLIYTLYGEMGEIGVMVTEGLFGRGSA
jgi:hypothetical protein